MASNQERTNEDRMNDNELEPGLDERLVQRYVDGELRASEQRALEERLASDEILRRKVEELKQLRSWFAASRQDGVPVGLGFADRVLTSVRREYRDASEETSEASAGLLQFLKSWTLVAASLLLGLGIAVMVSQPRRRMALDATPDRTELLRELDRQADLNDRLRREEERVRKERDHRNPGK